MTSRTTVALTTATLALASLTACGESAEQVAPETNAEASAEASVEPETVTVTTGADDADDVDDADDAGAAAPAPAAPAAAGELPTAVTDYTQEARAEMAEEGVSEADVEAALTAARNGEAEVEWDDDGYWEIEWRDIEVDINADGLVLDVDR
ncbi:hypothetical protein [Corynebacterium sp. HMSC034A01]|uniref:hypothetical protein n=1 Tax=Corynebacterium sp. HMSC034A01 TaxID=1739295 RepID=UPI0008AA0C7E|nr:hypothetical protein [Corynebacterium sp. HMSC034A01]OHR21155.1 hypothetical protein HMPREF2791_08560 [Corynebacterium sp. HMSC034A01]